MTAWPQLLEPVTGPFTAERIDGAAAGMGDHGPATRSIASSGLVPPDLLTGMTLFLLARQPRQPKPEGERSSGALEASPIAGGVWVRERFTIHRPLPRTDPFRVEGEGTGRHVHKGRRYGTNTSRSFDAAGRPVATNLTTGLLAYKVEAGLDDGVEGLPVEETPVPAPDRSAAAANPSIDALRAASPGAVLGGEPVVVSLALMAARDTENPDNPIHSDLDAAREAGLERPIAGGSHVQAFALELLLAEFGEEVLFHGAHLDARWKAPTHADATIVPTATVAAVEPDEVRFDLDVSLDDGRCAMTGSVVVPLP